MVRHNAVRALWKIGDPRAVKPLIKRLKHSDEGVRRDAAKALKQIARDDPRVKKAL